MATITKSEIDALTTAERLALLKRELPPIDYLERRMDTYGTTALEAINSKLFAILKKVYASVADGVQITDFAIIPFVLVEVVAIGKQVPQALKEIKDLDTEEIVHIAGKFIAEIVNFYVGLKNNQLT